MRALVLAKAPVPGEVKTRLGHVVGMQSAAGIAAACLLDTLATCRAAFAELHVSLSGEIAGSVRESEVRAALAECVVHSQHGETLGERIARAHADASGPGPTVQIGMDTPQVTVTELQEVAEQAAGGDAVLGPASDGGWWVLALRDSAAASSLASVPMSRPDTFALTRSALQAAGRRVRVTHQLTDVDTERQAREVAASLTSGHFLDAWRDLRR